MEHEYILTLSNPRADLNRVGGKGASLARLLNAGLPVPDGFHVTTAAYRKFICKNNLQDRILSALPLADPAQPNTLETVSKTVQALFTQAQMPPDVAEAITRAYAGLPGDQPVVAVRSSATAEDLPELSFAGQQDTYLNIHGIMGVLDAVKRCWASLWTGRAIGYRLQHGIDQQAVSLAVVVQLLAPAEAAGVLFTANLVDGRRDQVMITASWGLGEAVVGGLVTPDTLIVDKLTGHVIKREIAEKQVMTVRLESGTREQALPEDMRRISVLSDGEAAELARLGQQIEQLYGLPMDIEWARAEKKFAILQARPITALPETAPQIEWRLPDAKKQYMRGSIVDFMPDPLTPLFESMFIPSANKSFDKVVTQFCGHQLDLFVDYFTTINHYAYFSVNYSARQWLQTLLYMMPAMKKMIRMGIPYWQDEILPYYRATAIRWGAKNIPSLTPSELLAGLSEVFTAVTDHLTTLQISTLGITPGSEGLFTVVYDKLAKRSGDAAAPACLLGFESIPIRSEIALYELAGGCKKQAALSAYLCSTPAREISARMQDDDTPQGIDPSDWTAWQTHFHNYLEQFGYSIYNLDFASPLPMDEPAPLLETIKLYLSGQGKNPSERLQSLANRREAAVQAAQARVKGLKAWAFKKTLGWAQRYGPLREDSIAEIGLGYPVINKLLGELGRRFVQAGILSNAGDIYWLEYSEAAQAVATLERGESCQDMTGLVQPRKSTWNMLKRAAPPAHLPAKAKFLGINPDVFLGVSTKQGEGNTIHGYAASPGKVTATARVLTGPEDFDQMRPGDVLVAPITTPAWTPLFAMASAVVTDVGGPLSHGSIVAREYAIPAVLGTGVATRFIHSGQVVTVDGAAGTVRLSPVE